MRKGLWAGMALLGAALMCGAPLASAGEVDLLVQKLVEKGVLSSNEGQILLDETKQEVAKQNAKGTNDAIPAWVQTTKLKGDFRLRYQHDHAKRLAKTTITPDGDRMRVRMRLGMETKPNDKLLVGVGLATGKDDASGSTESYDQSRSTNQTLTDGFSKYAVNLDYAFAQYTPISWATLVAGKFKNPLWEPGDLIWDTDINPAGGALKLDYQAAPSLDVFLNTGALTIAEVTTASTKQWSSPTMYVAQSGVVYDLSDTVSLKGAVSYYMNTGINNKHLYGSQGTNSSDTGVALTGKLKYNYTDINPAVELSVKEPLKAIGIGLPYFSVFGEYVDNVAVKDRNTGYMGGFKTGNEKIAAFGDWQFRYNYAMLGRDSILDILPDSDRYSGKTGIRAHEGMLDFGLGKNTWLGLDYYYAWQLPGSVQLTGATQTKPASSMQVDWNMKF
ncbi:MAG: putative porin [Candidatus Omnitrophota bacterium]